MSGGRGALRRRDALIHVFRAALVILAIEALVLGAGVAHAQDSGTLAVTVRTAEGPLPNAQVLAGDTKAVTGVDGTASLTLAVGRVEVVVTHAGFDPAAAQVDVRAGAATRLEIDMLPQSEIEETIVVSATRSERRIQDEPLRVEVVPEEEVQEKIAMAPGDVSMLLAETNGLRVQTTSPSVGGASVRIQGLSGRYTQVLTDGLPLYGSQTGAVGILHIPPMDLAQVEVIKGVASALYGMTAIGGVVNLVSRRPDADEPERELLLNRTSHAGTDAALWLAQSLHEQWGVTFLGGTHWQERSDLDDDGWTDLPMFKRVQARPRVLWDNGAGRSLLLTAGAMTERRHGGTAPGANAPDGQPYAEHLGTRRLDGGMVGRFVMPGGRILSIRASAMRQRHERRFGERIEEDRTSTWFGESALTGTTGAHTWVGGVALQRDAFRALQTPRFDFTHTMPGVFLQDDYAINRQLTVSGGGRLDWHSDLGAFFSPRLSALVRPAAPVTARVSAGRGHFPPLPFTDETDATGLAPVAPLGPLESEVATSVSTDVTWTRNPLEITATVFASRVEHALRFVGSDGPFAAHIVNADQPVRTRGTELIARYHADDLDVILTHMYLWSREGDLDGTGTREVPLNPRHSASFDVLWEFGGSQLGFEAFYTGRQALDDNPFRTSGAPYVMYGILFTQRVGPALLYVNTENLGDVRQTATERLLYDRRQRDGRWTMDAWAPLEGRTLNAGLRWRF